MCRRSYEAKWHPDPLVYPILGDDASVSVVGREHGNIMESSLEVDGGEEAGVGCGIYHLVAIRYGIVWGAGTCIYSNQVCTCTVVLPRLLPMHKYNVA